VNLGDLMRDSSHCMVCGCDSEGGMRLEFVPRGDAGAAACGRIPALFSGFGGMAHGGAIAAVLDDAMWWAIHHSCGLDTVTAELKVRYCAPVPVERTIWVEGRVVKHRGRLLRAEAVIRPAGDEAPLAEGAGSFMTVDENRRGR
jgi:acyl-coenzyme A thioesterase PaaI-like protein